MGLTLNEIKSRAITFSREHADDCDEKSQSQIFWYDFLKVWGLSSRKIGVFEARARTLHDTVGFIDFFWPGTLLVEQKSRGKDLDKALEQALDYCLSGSLKETEVPRYIIVCDFERLRLLDFQRKPEDPQYREIMISSLHENISLFNFILGYEQRNYKDEDPVNIHAAELMGAFHDALKESGYAGHPLELFLVRLMFCLFADDTGIFPRGHFAYYLENKTDENGSNMGAILSLIFQILETSEEKRQNTLDEDLASFPYVNGGLFDEVLPLPVFDAASRALFLQICRFNWGLVSPAIFGSLFQSVMEPGERRSLGAHYTSEKNILKTIHGLFLDDLRAELEKSRKSEKALEAMLVKIKRLKLLDPACGCGNFLILSYRELRLLEIDIHKALQDIHKAKYLDLSMYYGIDVGAMYGIEIEEFPAQIARTAIWIMDHLMNVKLSEEFGEYIVRLPLNVSPHIVCANALRMDWPQLVKPEELSYILGNPPFVGAKFLTDSQRSDVEAVFADVKNGGLLDFVAAWYVKAADFIKGISTRCAFVSTNSLTQGEQVGVLWSYLFKKGVKIDFAHRTFRWSNEEKKNAAVHVIIIGFGLGEKSKKRIFDYKEVDSEPVERPAKNISPYLVEGKDIVIVKRNETLCNVPNIRFGNQPIDGGFLIIEPSEREEVIKKDKELEQFIRVFLGSEEFINGKKRYCLWLKGINPSILKKHTFILERLEKVRKFRLESKREATRALAERPAEFAFISHPDTDYLLIPSVSSEKRPFIPIGFMKSEIIASNLCLIIPEAERYHFGVLSSTMHMSWVRHTCGRLESRYRYSNTIVYNNFPWPKDPSPEKIAAVEKAAQAVLDARTQFPDSALADLYDPLAMPKALADAHHALDRAVDKCYRVQPFKSELERVEFLFDLYEQYVNVLGLEEEPKKKGKK